MPFYKVGHEGKLTSKLEIPRSYEQLVKFLQNVSVNDWFQLAEHFGDDERLKKNPHELIPYLNNDLKDTLQDAFLALAEEQGPEFVVNMLGNYDLSPTEMPERAKLFVKLLQTTYLRKRKNIIQGWVRIRSYDTNVSALWAKGDEYVLSVVSPVNTFRSLRGPRLPTILEEKVEFGILPPDTIVISHSFGYQIFLTNPQDIQTLYSFNPSTFIPVENPFKTHYFLNFSDIHLYKNLGSLAEFSISNAFSGVASSHSLAQWL